MPPARSARARRRRTSPAAENQPAVYLLGAGFARAVSRRMPLLQDLADRLLRRLGTQHLPTEVVAMMRENFAHALSYLEHPKPWVSEADNLRHRALFLELSNAIAHDLDATAAEAARSLRSAAPPWLTRLILHWHEHRCTVLTLNYDTLIETVAATLSLPGGAHISAQQLYPPLLTDAGLRAKGARAGRLDESFRLLKLHGSTNWYYSGRTSTHGEPIYFIPPLPHDADDEQRREHAFRLSAVADKYPFLVPPVYDKTALLTHETIRALWFEAGDALRRVSRLVCMGYSLPDSDLTMSHFLRTCCREGMQIELVDPAAEALRHFHQLFRGTDVRVSQTSRDRDAIAAYVDRLPRAAA